MNIFEENQIEYQMNSIEEDWSGKSSFIKFSNISLISLTVNILITFCFLRILET